MLVKTAAFLAPRTKTLDDRGTSRNCSAVGVASSSARFLRAENELTAYELGPEHHRTFKKLELLLLLTMANFLAEIVRLR